MDLLPQRVDRFKSVIARRQYNLTIVLENVHDPHNIGAVLRSCDSVGIDEIFIVYTDPRLIERGLEIGYKSASGARQWITIHYYQNVDECFLAVKAKYDSIYGTRLDDRSKSIYELNLTGSCALVFGNEHIGLSDKAASYLDSNFIIPQHGFVQSLNISVACAVTLYESLRQRQLTGQYDRTFGSDTRDEDMLDRYIEIHRNKKIPEDNS